jgi:hypothetical protein
MRSCGPRRASIPADDDELEMPAPVRVVEDDHYVTAAGRVSSLPPKVYVRKRATMPCGAPI